MLQRNTAHRAAVLCHALPCTACSARLTALHCEVAAQPLLPQLTALHPMAPSAVPASLSPAAPTPTPLDPTPHLSAATLPPSSINHSAEQHPLLLQLPSSALLRAEVRTTPTCARHPQHSAGWVRSPIPLRPRCSHPIQLHHSAATTPHAHTAQGARRCTEGHSRQDAAGSAMPALQPGLRAQQGPVGAAASPGCHVLHKGLELHSFC